MTATYKVDLQKASSGYDRETCWVQARCGVVPGGARNGGPLGVITTQKLLLTKSDDFFDMHCLLSEDDGVTWSQPQHQANVTRTTLDSGLDYVVGDMTPAWHSATRTLLSTGHDVYYNPDHSIPKIRPRHCTYITFDVASRTWNRPKWLELPDEPKYENIGAGCTQRWDLDDGRILLPVYYRSQEMGGLYAVSTLLCEFDGSEMRFVRQGRELTVSTPRGAAEPSVVKFGSRFFLTIRNDEAGFVAAGDDGLDFCDPVRWTFDDGSDLGSYNTQQHWVVHQDALFLVYTRRGLNNDHVFRHRAPLVMAQVDTEKLCVIRETERIITPERGARCGNFSITNVSPGQTWVTVAEWMQNRRPAAEGYGNLICEEYGSDNTIWVARIHWDTPNTAVIRE